ncbi:MAG: hypothetical protein ACXWWC_01190 [Chitinophagaceae bacterium]
MKRQRNEKKLTLICNTFDFMGLNDLHLSPSVLSALYPSSLINLDNANNPEQTLPIETKSFKKTSSSTFDTGWKYLGNNQKNILIVVNYENVLHLPDEELTFLTNMLTACKLNLGDVAIVNKNNYKETAYKDFRDEFKSKIIFLFGIEPSVFGLPVSFPFFQVQSLAGCTFLYTPSLEENRNDSLLRSKLWVSLRNIFGI